MKGLWSSKGWKIREDAVFSGRAEGYTPMIFTVMLRGTHIEGQASTHVACRIFSCIVLAMVRKPHHYDAQSLKNLSRVCPVS